MTIANDKMEGAISAQVALVNLVLLDDAERLSPLWNPVRVARKLGQAHRARAGRF